MKKHPFIPDLKTNVHVKRLPFLVILLISVSNFNLKSQTVVYVNDVRVSQEMIQQLSAYYNIQIMSGSYWYDNYTGAWGKKGGPGEGFIHPYLNLGGPLKENASNGNTGVFVNGRELHLKDVSYLQQFFKVLPGRYWVDAKGNGGYEGQYASFNLYQLARQSGKTFYRNSYTGIGGGSSGGTSYVIGKDFSVILSE